MSEEAFEDVFDEYTEEQETEVEDKEKEVDPSDDDQPEDKPLPRGYMTKEAWVEAGRDPEEWVSPEVFKERGERIKMKAELQRDFENRLKNINLFHQKQLEIQRQDLLSRRDEAIDTADKAEVKRLDKELKQLDEYEELNRVDETETPEKSPAVIEWESRNPWIFDPKDKRLTTAQRVFSAEKARGASDEDALAFLDDYLSAKFIDKSKKPAQIAEGSRSTAAGGKDDKPTLATLNAEEKKIWESGIFDSKEDFLKAVADNRKAGKK